MKRRTFSVGLGASLVAAPFVRFLDKNAWAADGKSKTAKRLVLFFSPNGTVHKHWRPTGGETDFKFSSGSILEPLSQHKKDLLILDGIDFYGVANHEPGMSAMLTGGGGTNTVSKGMSVDQYVAKELALDNKFQSMELGVHTSAWGASNQTRMSYSGPGLYVPPDDNPISVYTRMFGAVGGDKQTLDKAFLQRKSVLDLVRGELKSFKTVIGKQEQVKLDEHISALAQVEKGLKNVGKDCVAPEPLVNVNAQKNENFPAVTKAQLDLLVTALSCGMTNVASFQLSHTVGPPVFTWLGLSDGHHSLSHAPDSNPTKVMEYVKAERWIAEQYGYLLERLKALPEPDGDGTMLDHTAVVWVQEMGDGRLHDCLSVPFVLSGGPFKTGRYLKFEKQPHQKLLVSICHAMGLKNPTFGDPKHGTGALEGLI